VNLFSHADVAAAFVGGAVIGGFLGALYGMIVMAAQRSLQGPRRRRWRAALARTVPFRAPRE
jgi:hypothetical protein